MSISALAVMARMLHDLDLIKSDLGLLTLCSYAVNDLLAWVIFSLLLALAATSTVALPTTELFVGVTLTFTTMCLTLGRRAVDYAIAALTTHLPHQPGVVFTFVCCLGFSCGALTHGLGLNALFGFFLAGMMAGEARTLSERTRQVMSQMVHALFVPLYFAGVGLRFDFLATFDLRLAAFVAVVSIVVKFLGAWIGTLGTTLSRADRLSVGIAFTPGGVTEIILAKAALDAQIFTVPVFVAVVVAALFSSLLVGPLLMWSIRRRREVDMLEFVVQRTSVPYLRSTTRWGVIGELCQTLTPHTPRLDPAGLAQAVRAREELMGTARGGGIAIPYAHVESLQKPILTVGYSLHGVERRAPRRPRWRKGRAIRSSSAWLTAKAGRQSLPSRMARSCGRRKSLSDAKAGQPSPSLNPTVGRSTFVRAGGVGFGRCLPPLSVRGGQRGLEQDTESC